MIHTTPTDKDKKDKDNQDTDKSSGEDKKLEEDKTTEEERPTTSFINTRHRRQRTEKLLAGDTRISDLYPNQLYTRFNQPFEEEIPSTSNVVEVHDTSSVKSPARPRQSLVVIEDLKTKEIFASPGENSVISLNCQIQTL